MKKFCSVFFGLTLVAIAAAIVMKQMGVFTFEIAIWQIILAILAASTIITSLVQLEIGGVVFGVGLGWIAVGDLLGLPHFDLWVIIVVTILLSCGLSMIFPNKGFRRFAKNKNDNNCQNGTNESQDDPSKHYGGSNVSGHGDASYSDIDGFVNCTNTFGEFNKNVNCSNFAGANLNNTFGALRVNLVNANITSGTVQINLKNEFGETVLTIPKEWNVSNKMSVFAGDVKGDDIINNAGAPLVEIVGNVSFGEVVINRV